MSFMIEVNESFPTAIRRIAVEQIDLALRSLDDTSGDVNESIHAARQSLKRVRALLALSRFELGEKVFQGEWDCFKKAGQLFSGGRDAAVAVDTQDALIRHFSRQLAPGAFASQRRFLVERRDSLLKTMVEGDAPLQTATETLSAARERVAAWPLRHTGFNALRKGVRRSYRSGRDGFRIVIRHPTPANFHEWRRPVKLLWHQLQVLTPIWPVILNAHSEELRVLSDILNENHDLDVLRQAVLQSPFEMETLGGRSLISFIDRRCRELEARALPLGERLYSEPQRRFANRLKNYWRAWQHWSRDPAVISKPGGELAASAGVQLS